jgi:hypothetical protein
MDAAKAKNDIRHSGNLNALYDLGRGFTFSTLLFARTGIPVKPIVVADTQNDGNTVNDRPVINGQVAARDAFRQPGLFDWDMRLLKQFRLGERLRVDVSNRRLQPHSVQQQELRGRRRDHLRRTHGDQKPADRPEFCEQHGIDPNVRAGDGSVRRSAPGSVGRAPDLLATSGQLNFLASVTQSIRHLHQIAGFSR